MKTNRSAVVHRRFRPTDCDASAAQPGTVYARNPIDHGPSGEPLWQWHPKAMVIDHRRRTR